MSRTLRHRLRPGGPEITVRVIRSAQRQRTIALQLAPDGRVTLRTPLGTKREKLTGILRAKAAWLEHRLSGAWAEIPPPNPPREFVAGETFHFLGRQHRLRLNTGAVEDSVRLAGEFLQVDSRAKRVRPRSEIRARLKTWFIQQAQEFLPARVERWTSKVAPRQALRVVIANQSRRWASCGKSGVLRFNWRLMGLPVSLIDYVVVHELCHLKHPDHSAAFWKKLAEIMPDSTERERQLYLWGATSGF